MLHHLSSIVSALTDSWQHLGPTKRYLQDGAGQVGVGAVHMVDEHVVPEKDIVTVEACKIPSRPAETERTRGKCAGRMSQYGRGDDQST